MNLVFYQSLIGLPLAVVASYVFGEPSNVMAYSNWDSLVRRIRQPVEISMDHDCAVRSFSRIICIAGISTLAVPRSVRGDCHSFDNNHCQHPEFSNNHWVGRALCIFHVHVCCVCVRANSTFVHRVLAALLEP